MMKNIIALRRELHKHPELSNKEFATSERITQFISSFHPSKVIPISKTGKAFIFDSNRPGKTIMIRAELDALPIQEHSEKEHASINTNVAHLCGHDGHMAILAGLAAKITENPLKKGKLVLLFQPAEEVEQGALDVVNDPNFKAIKPDAIYALHNVPGFPMNQIILKSGSFAAASKGMTIKLNGKTAHAAEPENGISPAMAISNIIRQLLTLKTNTELFSDFILLTIIHIKLGEIAFGTSPGHAEIRLTLRAFENRDMGILTKQCEAIIQENAKNEKLQYSIDYSEVFPATINNPACLAIIKKSAIESNLDTKVVSNPFKWSEDFGYYSEHYQTGFFGIGAGEKQPALHNPNYDFPDELLSSGVELFHRILINSLESE